MHDQASVALMILIFLAGLIGLVFYFIPSVIAYQREHPHRLAIFVVNVLFGATVIGWVGTLVWALVTPRTGDFSVPIHIHDGRTDSASGCPVAVVQGNTARERREPRLAPSIDVHHAPGGPQQTAADRCRLCGQLVPPLGVAVAQTHVRQRS